MAHQLNIVGEDASFFSLRELPWHNLGTILDSPPTSEEAIKAAGLDFIVNSSPLAFYCDNDYKDVSSLNKLATYREDNYEALGIVSDKYKIIQNTEAFDFFDYLVTLKIFQYETAGALGKGEVIFISAKLNKEIFEISGEIDENIDVYILLTSSHDGTGAVRVLLTPTRVVCNNTLTWALENSKSNIVSIRHSGDTSVKSEQAKKIVQEVGIGIKTLAENIYKYKNTPIYSNSVKTMFAEAVYKNPEDFHKYITNANHPDLSQNSKNLVETIYDNYYHGVGQEEILNTKYGAINAVTGYLQNVKNYKNSEGIFRNTVLNASELVLRSKNILDKYYPS